MTKFPLEASLDELEADLDSFVDAIFSTLESEFLVVPRGKGFVEYPTFESAFEELKRGTDEFRQLKPEQVVAITLETPLVLIVLRTMLGFSPPEWAYFANQHSEVAVSQGYVRSLDRGIRMEPEKPLAVGNQRVGALVREVSAGDSSSNSLL